MIIKNKGGKKINRPVLSEEVYDSIMYLSFDNICKEASKILSFQNDEKVECWKNIIMVYLSSMCLISKKGYESGWLRRFPLYNMMQDLFEDNFDVMLANYYASGFIEEWKDELYNSFSEMDQEIGKKVKETKDKMLKFFTYMLVLCEVGTEEHFNFWINKTLGVLI